MQISNAEGWLTFSYTPGLSFLFFSAVQGKLLIQNKYVTVIPRYSYLFLVYDFFTMARMYNSCHIFRSSLLLFYKPNWEIVCIRHSAQQSLIPKNSTTMNQTTLSEDSPKENYWGGPCFYKYEIWETRQCKWNHVSLRPGSLGLNANSATDLGQWPWTAHLGRSNSIIWRTLEQIKMWSPCSKLWRIFRQQLKSIKIKCGPF